MIKNTDGKNKRRTETTQISTKNIFMVFGLGIFMFIFIINFTSATSENYHCVDNGISFGFKDQPTIKQDTDYFFTIHPYNSSDGSALSNTTTFCALHLYNSMGSHIISNNNIPFGVTPYDFYLSIDKGNFSELGNYPYVISCFDNGGSIGGTCSSNFLVTGEGTEPSTPQALMYGIILFIFLILFLGSFIWFNTIQWGHYTTDCGDIIQVNTERTKKIALFFISYILLLILSFTGKSMAENLMFINDTPVLFDVAFTILLVSIAPITIAAISIIILTTIADNKLQELMTRGIHIK